MTLCCMCDEIIRGQEVSKSRSRLENLYMVTSGSIVLYDDSHGLVLHFVQLKVVHKTQKGFFNIDEHQVYFNFSSHVLYFCLDSLKESLAEHVFQRQFLKFDDNFFKLPHALKADVIVG